MIETPSSLFYLCNTLNRLDMMRSTIESLVRLPINTSQELDAYSKKEEAKIISLNKTVEKKEVIESTEEIKPEANTVETKSYLTGYIKYPKYDFF